MIWEQSSAISRWQLASHHSDDVVDFYEKGWNLRVLCDWCEIGWSVRRSAVTIQLQTDYSDGSIARSLMGVGEAV